MANKSISQIERVLLYYTQALGKDYNAYRNHVYRVYHLTLLLCSKELNKAQEEALAIAAVFHDIGIWTHHSMDYLGPSAESATRHLNESGKGHLADLCNQIISNHHKLSRYQGEHAELIEAFRQADLMDLAFGKLRQGLPSSRYAHLRESFPFLGFQKLIIKKVISHAWRHPSHPFPMLKA
ncbi:HD domain-containing protein [Reichenbachiella ulvae]|uniref:HD domain-containing protein n=1 Tax=Reichenbachiella ulvae TaxID=2980104 RepID=A0ABT3CTD1_9BACT|nr:HD domain-containing protein [Reichenbachiella ulvae]MCV9386813.1 HD domain-containing protein [Reichenbachiella ulvae]